MISSGFSISKTVAALRQRTVESAGQSSNFLKDDIERIVGLGI